MFKITAKEKQFILKKRAQAAKSGDIREVRTPKEAERVLKSRGVKWDDTVKSQQGGILYTLEGKDVAMWFKNDRLLTIAKHPNYLGKLFKKLSKKKDFPLKSGDIEFIEKEIYYIEPRSYKDLLDWDGTKLIEDDIDLLKAIMKAYIKDVKWSEKN